MNELGFMSVILQRIKQVEKMSSGLFYLCKLDKSIVISGMFLCKLDESIVISGVFLCQLDESIGISGMFLCKLDESIVSSGMFVYSNNIWAAAWQNQQMTCAPSEDSDQKKHWALDSDQTGEMPRLIWDFAWRTSFCWFCRAAAHFLQKFMYAMQFYSTDPDQTVSHVLWCLIWIYSIYQEPCQGINEFILSYITCPISYHPCQLPTQ